MSNEEILKQAIPNFDNKDLPKFRVVFSRDFSDNVSQKILASMDTARKDEVEAWEEWKRDNDIFSFPYYYEGNHCTPKSLYNIFKNQNS